MLTQERKTKQHKNPRQIVEDFLSAVIEDDGAEMKDRLKASELLSKTTAEQPERPSHLEIRMDYGEGK